MRVNILSILTQGGISLTQDMPLDRPTDEPDLLAHGKARKIRLHDPLGELGLFRIVDFHVHHDRPPRTRKRQCFVDRPVDSCVVFDLDVCCSCRLGHTLEFDVPDDCAGFPIERYLLELRNLSQLSIVKNEVDG